MQRSVPSLFLLGVAWRPGKVVLLWLMKPFLFWYESILFMFCFSFSQIIILGIMCNAMLLRHYMTKFCS